MLRMNLVSVRWRQAVLGFVVMSLSSCGGDLVTPDGGDAGQLDEESGVLECGDERLPIELPPEPVVNGLDRWDSTIVDLSDGQVLAIGAVYVRLISDFEPSCTGTLITSRVVLTAGHCVTVPLISTVYNPSRVRFLLGPNSATPEQTFEVQSIARHPDYFPSFTTGNSEADLAVLILAEDAVATLPTLRPIPTNCNPIESESFVGQRVQSVGYGMTAHPDYDPPTNTIRWWSHQEVLRVTGYDFVTSGRGESALCSGDSGGPSMWTTPEGIIRVMGSLSFSDEKCQDGHHLTRVDDNCDFLLEHLGECGLETLEGRCESGRAIYCDAGALVEQDCAETDELCGESSDGLMRCMPDPCGDETLVGRCAGSTSIYCEDDTIHRVDCDTTQMVCGPDDGGNMRCVSQCGDLDWAGRCDGNDAVWCAEGAIRVRRCAECDQVCEWSDEVGGFYCSS